MSKSKEIESVIVNDLEVRENESQEAWRNRMTEAVAQFSGSESKQFGDMILNQLGSSCYFKKEIKDIPSCVAADIKGIAPKDHIEGMLATQMIATHYAIMGCYIEAAQSSSHETYQDHLNAANKLTRSFTMQIEALNRYRGKGQQKMTVEHVHVHSGGQAIVGTVSPTKVIKQNRGEG